MYSKELYLEDKEKKIELMETYFDWILNNFVSALEGFIKYNGYGQECYCCGFANSYNKWDEGYFGEEGVQIWMDYPVVENEVIAIFDNEIFFEYLTQYADIYIKNHKESLNKIRDNISIIKNKLKI